MDHLAALTIQNTGFLDDKGYRTIFVITKDVYKSLPDQAASFRGFFKEKTMKALKENPQVGNRNWMLDAFVEAHGNFSRDIFTVFAQGYWSMAQSASIISSAEVAEHSSDSQQNDYEADMLKPEMDASRQKPTTTAQHAPCLS
jgi:hypothetical protein